MTTTEFDSVHKLKRPFLFLVLMIVVAGFANWSERKLDDNRALEIRMSQGTGAEKRIAGTQPPTSAALLLQLRIASAILDPAKQQTRRRFSPFDQDTGDSSRRDDRGFGLSNSQANILGGQENSQSSSNPFSSSSEPSTSPYSKSRNSGFGQSSSSRTNTQSDTSTGLLSSDNPN